MAVIVTGVPTVAGLALPATPTATVWSASKAPRSQALPCGRATPRASVAGQGGPVTASIAGLAGSSGTVGTHPPRSPSAPSCGSVEVVPGQVGSEERLLVPKTDGLQLAPELEATTELCSVRLAGGPPVAKAPPDAADDVLWVTVTKPRANTSAPPTVGGALLPTNVALTTSKLALGSQSTAIAPPPALVGVASVVALPVNVTFSMCPRPVLCTAPPPSAAAVRPFASVRLVRDAARPPVASSKMRTAPPPSTVTWCPAPSSSNHDVTVRVEPTGMVPSTEKLTSKVSTVPLPAATVAALASSTAARSEQVPKAVAHAPSPGTASGSSVSTPTV